MGDSIAGIVDFVQFVNSVHSCTETVDNSASRLADYGIFIPGMAE